MLESKNIKLALISIVVIVGCSNNNPGAPSTFKEDTIEIIHGVEINDQYRWLEDFTSEKAKAWVYEQNKYTNQFIDSTRYKKLIANDLEKVWAGEVVGMPFKNNENTFYYYNDGSWQHSKLMIKRCDNCDPEVLIDPNNFSKDGTISLGGISISPDGNLIAYSLSDGGSDWRTWKFLNINSGELLTDELYWSKFSSAVWEPDSSGVYYQKYNEPKKELLSDLNELPKLMFHKIGDSQDDDFVIYENPNQPRWGWSISISEDGNNKILAISDGTEEKNRIYIKTKNSNDFLPIIDDLIGEFSYITSKESLLFFYSTYDAPNGKIMSLDVEQNSFIWDDIISEKIMPIRSANIVNNKIIITYLNDTLSDIQIYDLDGQLEKVLDLGLEGSISGFGGSIDDTKTYFSFSNYITPKEIYSLDLTNFQTKLFWKEELKSFSSAEYSTKLEFYESKDGTNVPIHISYKTDIEIDSSTPILLYGYGGFDISILPGFSKRFLAWMNQGGIVAVASIRGGSEYGARWHEGGMLFNKQNVFDDFAYAAKYLHANDIGSPRSTAIQGGSNGGLLVAATMLQNPDLFEVAIPAVGVLDMLRFHKFTIGWAWTSDYGSPEKKDEFLNLLSYSPYHNVINDECYPTTLVTTSNRDDRVVPSHSYKFAARLQEAQGCDNPILIRIEDRAGHGAGTPKYKRINQIAEVYGFALDEIIN